jgi:hypothetical protein
MNAGIPGAGRLLRLVEWVSHVEGWALIGAPKRLGIERNVMQRNSHHAYFPLASATRRHIDGVHTQLPRAQNKTGSFFS